MLFKICSYYAAGLVVCLITYLLALATFFGVAGFSPAWFGFRSSANFDQFGADVTLGLVAASIIGAAGVALLAFVLTGRWSNLLLLRLLLAGMVTIIVTVIVNYPFHSYWSFYGVLVPLGTSLFCGAVGAHIWQHSESKRKVNTRSELQCEDGNSQPLPMLPLPKAVVDNPFQLAEK